MEKDPGKVLLETRRKMREAQHDAKETRQRNLDLAQKLTAANRTIAIQKCDMDQLRAEVVKAEEEARRWMMADGAGRIKWAHDRIDGLSNQLAEVLQLKPQARTALALAKQKLERQKDDEVLGCICRLLEEVLSGT